MLELFDKMVIPIANYGSEVWGTNYIPHNPNNNLFLEQANLSKQSTEILHYRYIKILLGVHRQTTNWAVSSETGRLPIIINTFISMIKYFFHLSNSESPLVQAALATNISLAQRGVNNWFKAITRICAFCKLEHILYTCDIREIEYQIRGVKKLLTHMFLEKWEGEKSKFATSGKLELFVSLKPKFEMSDYLKVKMNPSFRAALAKMRLSAHKFPIETGRYDKIPREERICPLGCNKIGNEYHYLTDCSHPAIYEASQPIIKEIEALSPAIASMNAIEKGKALLDAKDTLILIPSAKLCQVTQTVFKELTW